jgi:uncharacterized glyoxalase superfamily protein PhnB
MTFYEKAFGFSPGEVMRGTDGKVTHCGMRYQGRDLVMFAPEGAWGSSAKTPAHMGVDLPSSFYVYCEDVDALAAQAKNAGAKVEEDLADQFWGDRTVFLKDPDGYGWMFATKVGEFDPAKMPKEG